MCIASPKEMITILRGQVLRGVCARTRKNVFIKLHRRFRYKNPLTKLECIFLMAMQYYLSFHVLELSYPCVHILGVQKELTAIIQSTSQSINGIMKASRNAEERRHHSAGEKRR